MISDETKPPPQKEHYRAPHGAVWPVRYEVIHTLIGSRIPCGEDEEEALVTRDLTCVTCPTCKAEAVHAMLPYVEAHVEQVTKALAHLRAALGQPC